MPISLSAKLNERERDEKKIQRKYSHNFSNVAESTNANLVTKLPRIEVNWFHSVFVHIYCEQLCIVTRAFPFDTHTQFTYTNVHTFSTSTLISLNKHRIIHCCWSAFYTIRIFFSILCIIIIVADGFRSHCNNFIWCTLLLNVKNPWISLLHTNK